MSDIDDIQWFIDNGHWLIRKKPFTKDEWYVVCGSPPFEVLSIYGIKYYE